jgi:hypothetical protein
MKAIKTVEVKDGGTIYRAEVARLTFGGRMIRDAMSSKLADALKARQPKPEPSAEATDEANEAKPAEATGDIYDIYVRGAIWRYASAVAQTTAHKGFMLPTAYDSGVTLLEAFETTINTLPIAFVEAWFDAVDAANAPLMEAPKVDDENPT